MITKVIDGATGTGVISKVFPKHLDAWAKRNPDKPVYVVCDAWQRTTLEYDLQRIGSSVQPRYISNAIDSWRGMPGDALLIFYQISPGCVGDTEQVGNYLVASSTPVWFVGCENPRIRRITPMLWVPGAPVIRDLDKMLEAADAD